MVDRNPRQRISHHIQGKPLPATTLLATIANKPGPDTHHSQQDGPGGFDLRVMFAPRRRSCPWPRAPKPRWSPVRTAGPSGQEARPRSRDAEPERTHLTRRPSDHDHPEFARRWRRTGWSELPRMRSHSRAQRRGTPPPERIGGWGWPGRSEPHQAQRPRTYQGILNRPGFPGGSIP